MPSGHASGALVSVRMAALGHVAIACIKTMVHLIPSRTMQSSSCRFETCRDNCSARTRIFGNASTSAVHCSLMTACNPHERLP